MIGGVIEEVIKISLGGALVRFKYNISFILLGIGIVFLCLFSEGGIDISVYQGNSKKSVLFWGGYELKEFVSWLIIKGAFTLSSVIGLDKPFLMLNAILFSLSLFLIRGIQYRRFALLFILVSPFGVMLAFNVLRQYIAVVFFLLALINLYEGRVGRSVFIALLSFFSHNSILPFILLIYATFLLNNLFLCTCMFLFLYAYLPIFNYFFGGGGYEDPGITDSGKVDPIFKVIINELYVLILFVFAIFRLNYEKVKNKFVKESRKFVNTLFFFNIMLLFSPLPFWAINRLLINIGIILMLIVFYSYRKRLGKKEGGLVILLILLNLISLLLHPGARNMVV